MSHGLLCEQSHGGVYSHLMAHYSRDGWERIIVFGTSINEVSEVFEDPHFALSFLDRNDVDDPFRVRDFLDESRFFEFIVGDELVFLGF